MGILEFLGLEWKPRKNMTYRYKRWHRVKKLIWRQSGVQGNPGLVPEGTRSQNISKIYVIINGESYLGTFKVSDESVKLGIVHHKKVKKVYKTGIENVEFSKKYVGETRIHPSYGKTVNIIKNYKYTAKVLDSTKLLEDNQSNGTVRKRRRGAAIVDTLNGILVVSGKGKLFILPGGGARKGESRRHAAIRELKEETGLNVIDSKYLFRYVGGVHKSHGGGHFQDHNKVFLMKTTGTAQPKHEVKNIEYYKDGSDINVSDTTKKIIEKYYELKK